GLASIGRAVHELARRGRVTQPLPISSAAVPTKLRNRLREATGTLTEHQSKAILAQYGVRVAPGILVRNRDELDEAVRALGFPLALKVQSPDLPHKTEVGGVRLNIADAATLRVAYEEVISALAVRAPCARLDGVRLEPMAPAGIEIIVGVIRDELFGPVLMVGAGGGATELFRDVAYRLGPGAPGAAPELPASPPVKAVAPMRG